eukprot:jgi/Botrbrau1/16733/Bobra.0301s0004.2
MSPQRDWMFCNITGHLLAFDALHKSMNCPRHGLEGTIADLREEATLNRTKISFFRTQFNLDPLVKGDIDRILLSQTGRHRATVDEQCVKCGNEEVEFYTMQLRSADEGSTVFYECKKCGHKWSTNN